MDLSAEVQYICISIYVCRSLLFIYTYALQLNSMHFLCTENVCINAFKALKARAYQCSFSRSIQFSKPAQSPDILMYKRNVEIVYRNLKKKTNTSIESHQTIELIFVWLERLFDFVCYYIVAYNLFVAGAFAVVVLL